MNINSFIDRDEISKEQEKAKGGGDADSRFWRIPDKKSTIRLLPRLESKVPWKTVKSHRYNKNGEKIFSTCLKTFGNKDCPICKQSWKIHESAEEKDIKDAGYEARPTARYLFNCYIVNDAEKPENNGSIKIISVGKKLFDLILESYNSEDLGMAIFDALNGVNFEINRKKSGDNPNFPDYSSSRFVFKKDAIAKSWDEIKEKLINIDELIKEETPEEMKEKFKFLGFDSVASSTPKQKPPTTVKNESKKKEEEDINLDELESDNGDEETSSISDDIDIEEELSELDNI